MLNKNKGITLVSLAVSIVILAIIAGVGVTVGIGGVKETKDAKLASELNMVQHAVLEQYTKFKTTKDSNDLVGTILTQDEINAIVANLGITLVNIPNTYSNAQYYKLNKQDLQKIGITNTNDEYVVNYISGEVINTTKQKDSQNKPLYVKSNSFINI